MIRIVLCDDHGVVRAGLASLIATFDGVEVVATAARADEAVNAIDEHGADVVLMDLEMPGPDGIAATRRIRAGHPGTAVVILTSFSDRARILEALEAGAVGYMLKDATPAELESGIRAAARGESPLHPRAASALLAARCAPPRRPGCRRASARCWPWWLEGLPNKLIARRLGISEKTVKAHLTSVFRTIGVDDRTQAAMWAVRNGIGPPGAGGPRTQRPIARAGPGRDPLVERCDRLAPAGAAALLAVVACAAIWPARVPGRRPRRRRPHRGARVGPLRAGQHGPPATARRRLRDPRGHARSARRRTGVWRLTVLHERRIVARRRACAPPASPRRLPAPRVRARLRRAPTP